MIADSLWFICIGIYQWKNEKIDVRMRILKPHTLNPPSPKRHSDVFGSKIDLRVAPKVTEGFGHFKKPGKSSR